MIAIETFENCTQASQKAASVLVQSLADNASKNNLLLVSGGSSAKVAFWAASELDLNATNSTALAQVDERFGEIGHKDSNWQYLIEKGLDASLFSQQIEMLKLGLTPEDIAETYSKQLQELIDQSDYSVALLGLGEDGHIAGILPNEPARFDELFLGDDLAVSYQGKDYERITITARALLQMGEVIVYACGGRKAEAINSLNENHAPNEFPAEILKKCSKVTVYYGKEES